jgi:hypothetical protein
VFGVNQDGIFFIDDNAHLRRLCSHLRQPQIIAKSEVEGLSRIPPTDVKCLCMSLDIRRLGVIVAGERFESCVKVLRY